MSIYSALVSRVSDNTTDSQACRPVTALVVLIPWLCVRLKGC